MSEPSPPVLALTQGDPAGIGPEIVLRVALAVDGGAPWRPLVIAERSAIEACRPLGLDTDRLRWLPAVERPPAVGRGEIAAIDPVGVGRTVTPGAPTAADAGGALAALDLGIELAASGTVDALITAPVSKLSIATHVDASFRGHTDHLAAACGLERYGRDYLMAFLAPDLRVALLTTHLPLSEALAAITTEAVDAALGCLARSTSGSIAVAGLNPHAGEGGLMGDEESRLLAPAIQSARERGIDAHGPESADSLFARARRGAFDWVLALYHDQGLIAVKTAAFGAATNWTVGLPFLRTSVDHGTAFELAGTGRADPRPLAAVIETTLELLAMRRAAVSGAAAVVPPTRRSADDR